MTNWHKRIDGLLNPQRDLEDLAHEMAVEIERLNKRIRALEIRCDAIHTEYLGIVAGRDETIARLEKQGDA